MSKSSTVDNIHVTIRVRPLNDREISSQQYSAWNIQNSSYIYQVMPDGRPIPSSTGLVFDKVFQDCDNQHLYDGFAREIIESAVDGVNGTIFAYGQTSSGKTHTMQGNDERPGIIPLAVRDIFQLIEKTPDREFLLRLSYLEIYNEVIRDLLKPGNDNLKIHETVYREIFVGNLTEEIVTTPEDVYNILKKGDRNRHVGVTNMNERSSRSHTVFRMVLESRARSSDEEDDKRLSLNGGAIKVSCLNLVDLAGSERASHSGAEGIRLKEGGHINKSLLTLATVIGKLSEGGDNFIPYRDSKLTRILQPSLGGNARTAIVCTITPASGYVDETLSTLKFASRAKNIRNTPTVNEIVSDEAMLKQYRKEINTLKRQLNELQEEKVVENIVPQTNTDLEKQQQMLQEKIEIMTRLIINDTSAKTSQQVIKKQKTLRRKTWFPGTINIEASEDDEQPAETADRSVSPAVAQKPIIESLLEFKKNFEVPQSVINLELEEQKQKVEELKSMLVQRDDEINRIRHESQTIEKFLCQIIEEDPSLTCDTNTGVSKSVFDYVLKLKEGNTMFKDKMKTIVAQLEEKKEFLFTECEIYQQELNDNQRTIDRLHVSNSTLNQQLSEKIENEKSLLSAIDQINHEVEIQRTEKQVISKEYANLEASRNADQALINSLQQDMERERADHADDKAVLERKLSEYEIQSHSFCEQFEASKSLMTGEIESLRNKVQGYKEKEVEFLSVITELRQQLENSNDDFEKLALQSDNITSVLERCFSLVGITFSGNIDESFTYVLEIIEAKESLLNELRQENKKMFEKLNESSQVAENHQSQLSEQCTKLDFENRNLKDRIMFLESELENTKVLFIALQENVALDVEMRSSFLADVVSLKNAFVELKDDTANILTTTKAEFLRPAKLLKKFVDQFSELQTQNRELVKSIENAESELDQYRTQSAEMSNNVANEMSRLNQKNEEYEMIIHKLQSEKKLLADEQHQMKKHVETKVQEFKEKYGLLKHSFEESCKAFDDKQAEVEKLQNMIGNGKLLVSDYEDKLSNMNIERETLIESVEHLRDELHKANETLTKYDRNNKTAEDEMMSLRKHVQSLQNDLENLGHQNQKLQNKIHEILQQQETSLHQHQIELTRYENLVSNLQEKQMHDSESIKSRHAHELSDLQSQIEILKSQLDESRMEIPSQDFLEGVERMKTQIEQGKVMLSQLQNQNENLLQSKQIQENEMINLKEKLKELESTEKQLNTLLLELEFLKKELSVTRTAKNEIESALKNIESDNEGIRRINTSLKAEVELLKQEKERQIMHCETNENVKIDDNRPLVMKHPRESANAKPITQKLPEEFVRVPNSRRNIGQRLKKEDECNQQ